MPYPTKFSAEAVVTARQYAEQAKPFPSMGRLAERLGIDRRTVHRWRVKHEAFNLAMQAIEARQRYWQHQISEQEYRGRLVEIDRELDVCNMFADFRHKI
ncbi:helix-turn-helix domain-containing protein [Marinobacterium marinum]|uniref:Homeodomain phBC6A51-type domain-containing protein n=1 Tax=Marinobacterium marinum TaxID=2756129 RepID=A0A7W2AAF4_9GAMM|nr:hypothetical protein [Marinobacterium marinum]MBA4501836.1 hypothetical protein [Marinobacterium marinum]